MDTLTALLLAPPLPQAIVKRITAPRAAPIERPARPGFVLDSPFAISTAYAEVERFIDRGVIMRDGQRNELAHKFLARMHGLGLSQERAFELFEYWIEVSGGDRPDDEDGKIAGQLARIWSSPIYNAPGSELPLRARDFGNSNRLPDDRLWFADEMIDREPPSYWDAEKLVLKPGEGGSVAVWFGKWGHHKTNFVMSKLFALMRDTEARVLYLIGEGEAGFGRRLKAHAEHVGRTMPELRDRLRVQRVPQASSQASVDAIHNMIMGEAEWRPDIIVLDTLATALAGEEEDNRAAGYLTRNGSLGRLAGLLSASMIVIGHEGEKAGKLRGGSAFYGNTDQVVYILANADSWARALKATTVAPSGKVKEDEGRTVYHGISYDYAAPVTFPIGRRAWELLSGDAEFNSSSVAGALARLEASSQAKAVTSLTVVREMYPKPEAMDGEEHERLLGVLTRTIEKAAKDNAHLGGLSVVADKRRLWFIA